MHELWQLMIELNKYGNSWNKKITHCVSLQRISLLVIKKINARIDVWYFSAGTGVLDAVISLPLCFCNVFRSLITILLQRILSQIYAFDPLEAWMEHLYNFNSSKEAGRKLYYDIFQPEMVCTFECHPTKITIPQSQTSWGQLYECCTSIPLYLDLFHSTTK